MEDLKNNGVAIFTTFYMVDEAYSLCNVVEDQLRMFIEIGGYKIKLIVDEGLDESSLSGIWKHPNVTLEKIPGVYRSNEGVMPLDYKEQVDKVYFRLKEILKDCKVVICHDITLQCAHLIHNLACRMIAEERNDLRFFHLSHSATSPEVRCSDPAAREIIQKPFPGNAIMLYPNDWDKHRVALNYKYEMDRVKFVPHCSDFLSLLFGDEVDLDLIPNLSDEARQWLIRKVNYPIKLSKDFIKEFDILNADVISVYPCRLDRGKNVEWNIRVMAKIKELGRSVRMIIIDFHSTGSDKVVYRHELQGVAKKWGLTDKECIFTSQWKENTNLHVPRQFVMNLKKISDFHQHSSTSETYSLVVQESIATKNFIICNHHTPYMRDLWGSKNVLHIPMGGAVDCLTGEDGSTTINITNEQKHFDNLAKKVLYFIENNPVLNEWRIIRQTRNLQYVFRNFLEPLLYETKLE